VGKMQATDDSWKSGKPASSGHWADHGLEGLTTIREVDGLFVRHADHRRRSGMERDQARLIAFMA